MFSLDAMLTLGAIARATERIGLVATISTTFNQPYNLASSTGTPATQLPVKSPGASDGTVVTGAAAAAGSVFGNPVALTKALKAKRRFLGVVATLAGLGSYQ